MTTSNYQIAKSELISALEVCSRVTKTKTVQTSLQHARLHLNGSLAFSATDAIMSVVGERKLEKSGADGIIGLNPSKLLDAVRHMADGTIKLSLKDGQLTATSGARKITLATIPADALPAPVDPPGKQLPFLPAKTLASLVERVRWAVVDSARPTSDGIHLSLDKGKLTAATVCSYHAIRASVEIESTNCFTLHIPPGLVDAVLAAANSSQDVQLGADGGFVFVKSAGALYRFLPQSEAGQVDTLISNALAMTGIDVAINVPAFVDALDYTKSTLSKLDDGVTLTRNGTELRFDATAGEGQATDSSDVIEVAKGGAFQVKVNPAFLLPALKQAADAADLTFTDAGHIVIKTGNYSCAVMGMVVR